MSKLMTILCSVFLVTFAGLLYTGLVRGQPDVRVTELKKQESATQAFELSPERGRFAHVVALAETGQYALSQELADFVYPDVGWHKGRFYSFFAPGMSYMAVPFYLLGKPYGLAQVATFGFVAFISLCSLLLLFLIARQVFRLPRWSALLAALVFGFGSTALSYSLTLYQHHITVFCLLLIFYAAWRFRQSTTGGVLWASLVGLAYGLAVTVDYPNAVLLFPGVLYCGLGAISYSTADAQVKIRVRAIILASLVLFLSVTALHGYHNFREFGSWKALSSSVVDYKVIKEQHLESLPVPDIEKAVAARQERKSNVANFFSETHLPNSFGTLIFSVDRGLLFYGPIFILGLLGLAWALRRVTPEIMVLGASLAVNVFLYSSWGDPWGGWAYGTRYLIPSMAILSLFVAYLLAVGPRAWVWRLLSIPLFTYSAAVAMLGALTTNAVPPRVEADYLHSHYNYLHNLTFFFNGSSGSYFFNEYASRYVSLQNYGFILFTMVLVVYVALVSYGHIFSRKAYAHAQHTN